MLKTLIRSTLALSTLLAASAGAEANPWSSARSCETGIASHACRHDAAPGLLPIRDTRASMGGGGGGSSGGGSGGSSNSCWSACFSTYNNCVDKEPKNQCVLRMKTCLAICDTSAN